MNLHRPLLALLCSVCLLAACTTTKAKPDDFGPEDKVLYSPPEGAESAPVVPRSAPVVARERSQELPESTSPEDAQLGGELVITKEEIEGLVSRGPSFPLSQIELRPHRQDGKVVGYRVESFYNEGARAALAGGLQQGDVITHLMGVSMLSPNNYHLAWSQLASASSIRVDFRRASQPGYVVWVVQP